MQTLLQFYLLVKHAVAFDISKCIFNIHENVACKEKCSTFRDTFYAQPIIKIVIMKIAAAETKMKVNTKSPYHYYAIFSHEKIFS